MRLKRNGSVSKAKKLKTSKKTVIKLHKRVRDISEIDTCIQIWCVKCRAGIFQCSKWILYVDDQSTSENYLMRIEIINQI